MGIVCCAEGRNDQAADGKIGFMSVTELKAALDDKMQSIVVLDCSVDKDPAVAQATYAKNHIPKAHYFNMNRFVDTGKVPFTFQFPADSAVSDAMKEFGFNHDARVCCYD